jgi:hypothetical protein
MGTLEIMSKVLDDSRLGFSPPTMERYPPGPLAIMVPIIVWPGTVIVITWISEWGIKKREKKLQRGKNYSDQSFDHENAVLPTVL